MILGYTLPNAKDLILKGIKLHTIREDRTNRWKVGNKIHHSLHVRQKNYECFLLNKCEGVQMILLVMKGKTLHITIDRRRLKYSEIMLLAKNDGFKDLADLMEWFMRDEERTMWAGKIIHWTDLKY